MMETELGLVNKLRPKDKLYSKTLNVDKNGNKIVRGTIVRYQFYNIDKLIALCWNHKLGWYYMDSLDQPFIMPTHFYPNKRIQVFHLCEVNIEFNKLVDKVLNENY